MKLNEITETIIGASFEVYNVLGYGFVEKVYERALAIELELRGVKFKTQHQLGVEYKGRKAGIFTADFVVEGAVIVELKAVSEIHEEHVRQCINYLKGSGRKLGLVVNFIHGG